MLNNSRRVMAVAAMLVVTAPTAWAGEVNWWVAEPGYKKAQELVKQFEAKNPDIHVRLQSNPYGGLQGKVMIALRSGQPPDLLEVQTSWVPSYIATGKLAPMQDAISKTTPIKDFLPVAIKSASDGGNVYALPFQAESLAMIYNKDMFKAAGLDPKKPPQTWKALIADAQKLTKPNATPPQYGYGIAGGGPEGEGNTLYRSLPYLWMNGGGILSPDGKKVVVNSAQSVAGITFYTDMYTKYHVAPPSTLDNDSLQLRRLFISGAIAMYQGTPTELERFKTAAPNLNYGVAIMPHPQGKETTALLGGWAFIMPKDRKHKDDTLKLVQFLASTKNVGFYTRTFPTIKAALDLPRFSDPKLAAFKEMQKHGRPQPDVAGWLRISSIYYQHVQDILLGSATPQKAMDAAAKEIQAVLDHS